MKSAIKAFEIYVANEDSVKSTYDQMLEFWRNIIR
jgi:hypothetical protein